MTIQDLASVAGVVVAGIGVFKWMLKSHEDVCTQRWIAAKAAHDELTDMTGERHRENLERFRTQDQKLDTIIGHLLKR